MKKILTGILLILFMAAASACAASQKNAPTPSVTYPADVRSTVVDARGKMGKIWLLVAVKDHAIYDIRVLEHNETPEYADQALEQIPKEIVEKNTLDVDAVTGATRTSEAIIKGTEKALDTLGIDPEELE